MKHLIGLLTAVLITGIASAQHGNAPAGHVTLGVKGGLNMYNIHNDNNTSYDQRTVNGHFSLNWYIPPRVQKIMIWAILMYPCCFNICLTMDSGYRPALR
jgi:hypothetical protein